jgi:hypothetical protein
MTDPRLAAIPKLLETPKRLGRVEAGAASPAPLNSADKDLDRDRKNLATRRKLVGRR